MAKEATITFTEEELMAVGLIMAQWAAENEGVSFIQALHLLAALEDVDQGVWRANVHRVMLRMSVAEEEVFGRTDMFLDIAALHDKRAQIHANLDQAFMRFKDEGRKLFQEGE